MLFLLPAHSIRIESVFLFLFGCCFPFASLTLLLHHVVVVVVGWWWSSLFISLLAFSLVLVFLFFTLLNIFSGSPVQFGFFFSFGENYWLPAVRYNIQTAGYREHLHVVVTISNVLNTLYVQPCATLDFSTKFKSESLSELGCSPIEYGSVVLASKEKKNNQQTGLIISFKFSVFSSAFSFVSRLKRRRCVSQSRS